ncbi:Villin [Entamoeba marina]
MTTEHDIEEEIRLLEEQQRLEEEEDRLFKEEEERMKKKRKSWKDFEEEDRLFREEEERLKKEEEELEKQLEEEQKEAERLEKEEAEQLEKERLEKEEAERLEKERLEKEEAERLEKERLEKEEAERLEKERLEKEEAERLEKERLEKEEAERLEKERLEKERLEKEEKERLEKEEAERLEKERLEKEEAERLEKEEAERLEKEEAERLEKERLEKEEAERIEKERLEKEEAERLEKEEVERLEKERLEKERLEKEEAERLEKERLEKEEAERLEKERLEKEEAERLEKERLEKERLEKEEAERLEKERLEKEEAERIEKERLEKEEAERIEKEEKKLKEEEEKMAKELEEEERQLREEEERIKQEEEEMRLEEERIKQEEEEMKLEEERIKQEEEEMRLEEEKSKEKTIQEIETDKIQLEEVKLDSVEVKEVITNEVLLKEEMVEEMDQKIIEESSEDSKSKNTVNNALDILCTDAAARPVVVKRLRGRARTHVGKATVFGGLRSDQMKTEYIEPTQPINPMMQPFNPMQGLKPGLNGKITKPTAVNPLIAEMQNRRLEIGKKPVRERSLSPAVDDGIISSLNYKKVVRVSGKYYMKWRIINDDVPLNSGDVYLIDNIDKIYVWIGKDSSRLKRTKVCDAANTIKHTERQGKCDVVQILQGREDEAFWMSAGKREIVAPTPKQDEEEDKSFAGELYLIDTNKDGDAAEIVETTTGKIGHSMYPWKVYVFDCENEVYLWVGSKAPQELRKNARVVAKDIFDSKKRSDISKLIRVTQQTEPVLFKEKFANTQGKVEVVHNPECSYSQEELEEKRKPSDLGSRPKISRKTFSASPSPEKGYKHNNEEEESLTIDLREMLGIPDDSIVLQESKDFIIQGGSVKIYIVVDGQKQVVSPEFHGQFYSMNDYIIDYQDPKEELIVFYWQGKDTSIKSRGKTSVLTSNLTRQTGAKSIRVPQGEEPHAFMQLFEDKYIVHIGNFFEREEHQKTERLYQVSNTISENTCEYTVQRELSKNLLHSASTYLYITENCFKLWRGKHATDKNYEVAKEAAIVISSQPFTEMNEKSGDKLFDEVTFDLDFTILQPKCYQLILEKNNLRTKLMKHIHYNRFKLPTVFCCQLGIYLFVVQQKKDALMPYLQLIHDYREKVKDNYSGIKVPPITVIHSLKHVPLEIASILHGFDRKSLKGCDLITEGEDIIDFDKLWNIINSKYSYEELCKRPIYLDKTKLESYLNEEEFQRVFNIKREVFYSKRPFERDILKKQHKLF